jgi:hypothetical protein
MMILFLGKTYFKATDTQAAITKKYEHCIAEIKLATKDKLELRHAVNFLISEAEQALSEWDDVHLYLPASDGIYLKKTFVFPLKLVLPLVWLALKDHAKYAHDINYPGTKEQQFARSRGEYKMRLDNFFNLLILHDEDIDSFWNHADNSTPFRDITVYLTNRICLHASFLSQMNGAKNLVIL